MRGRLLMICLLWLVPRIVFAVSGGEMTYKYLGPGVAPNTSKYQVTLYTSAYCKNRPGVSDGTIGRTYFTFWNNSSGHNELILITDDIIADSTVTLSYVSTNKCNDYNENFCFRTTRIRTVVELPILPEDYTITTNEKASFRPEIENVVYGSTSTALYIGTIPGTKALGNQPNSTPDAVYPPQIIGCANASFSYDFSEKDPDGDKLTYEFCGLQRLADPSTAFPIPPPYSNWQFQQNYPVDQQLGETVQLDKNTGLLSGVAPSLAGVYYMASICISEYRNGKLINQHPRTVVIFLSTCNVAKAELNKEYIKCKDFTFNFKNEFVSTLPISYHWDFGVAGKTDDTSSSAKPVFTFPDTGIYKIKLVINGLGNNSECKDSATSLVRVYPGFKPGFITRSACASVPVEFIDTSTTLYGKINSWNWRFDDYFNIGNDTSTLQNPKYKYVAPGSFNVSLVAGSTVGCVDTVFKRLTLLDTLLMSVSRDTLICAADSVKIYAYSLGNITWQPNYNISDPHSFSPWVSPDVDTRYVAHVDAGPGCASSDSVLVRSLKNIQISLPQRMDICVADTAHLFASSNGANAYQWAGNNIVSSKDSADIFVHPSSNTWYYITATLGNCKATDSVQVRLFDYPGIRVYGDTNVCAGKEISIHVRGNADVYTWTPATQVSDVNSLDPVITPMISTAFHVEATDTTGCTKPVDKRVIINVIHKFKASAGNDTTITAGQSLQLNAGAAGATNYVWTPTTGLSDPNIANPTAVLNADMEYYVKVSNDEGCTEYDSLHVRVLKTGYDILVPNAFTPNGDGLNDVFRPIPVGIKEFYSFEIFDKWGKIVFRSSTPDKGWDGRVNGQLAQSGTYVWMVKGLTVDNKQIEKHGTVVLLR